MIVHAPAMHQCRENTYAMTHHRAGLATVSFPKMGLGERIHVPDRTTIATARTGPQAGTRGARYRHNTPRDSWRRIHAAVLACRLSQPGPAGRARQTHTNHERGLHALPRPLRNGTDRGPPLPTPRSADASALRTTASGAPITAGSSSVQAAASSSPPRSRGLRARSR